MLRINLLPPYIYEGAKRRNVTVLWLIILLAVIGGLVYAKMQIAKETDEWKTKEAAINQQAVDADKMAADAGTINNDSKIIRDKADFVKSAREHTQHSYQHVLENIAMWTWPRVMYDGVKPDGQAVTLPAYAPSLADVGHYMIYMERNPEIRQVDIQMSSIPSFPAGANQQRGSNNQATGLRPLTGGGHDFTATLTLVKPIPGAPVYPPGSGGGGGNAGGGAGGPGPGFSMPGGGFGGGAPSMSGGGMSGGRAGA